MPMPQPGPDGRHDEAGEHGAEGDGAAHDQAREPVGLLQQRRAHDLRHEPDGGRPEERLADAHAHLQQRQVPHFGDSGDEQRRGDALQAEPQEVRDQHHLLTRQAIGPHAADEQEHGERHEVGGLDYADVGGRAADLEHRKGQGDVGEHDADHGGGLPEEQLAVLGFAERGEVVGQLAHAGILLGSPARAPPAARGRRGHPKSAPAIRSWAAGSASSAATSSSGRAGASPPAPSAPGSRWRRVRRRPRGRCRSPWSRRST